MVNLWPGNRLRHFPDHDDMRGIGFHIQPRSY